MKFLALADLHYNNNYAWKYGYFQSLLKDTIEKYQIDVVLIAGDVIESSIIKHYNPYEVIRHNIFKDVDVPIIFCLGNHEFSYNSVDNVFERMTSFTDTYDCYCLDVNGHYDVNSDIRIVGNVLWYDNTLKGISTQPDDVIIDGWLDSTILDFIPSVNCARCKKQIKNNIKNNVSNILLTHCVPHKDLNRFSFDEPYSIYNMYSGCEDFLKDLSNLEWAICGHTHRRMNKVIHNINCLNIGNDYVYKTRTIEKFIFEV